MKNYSKSFLQQAKDWDGVFILELLSIAKHLNKEELIELRHSKPLPFTKPVVHTVIACDQGDQCLVLNDGRLEVLSVLTIKEQQSKKPPLTGEFSKTTTGIRPDSLEGYEYFSVRHTDGTVGFLIAWDMFSIFLFNTSDPQNSYPSDEMPTTVQLLKPVDPMVLVKSQDITAGGSLTRAIDEGTLLASIFKYTFD